MEQVGFRIVLLFSIVALAAGCKKDAGCTKFGSENYDPEAVVNDGSCISVRDKFIGDFDVNSDCITDNYERTITEGVGEYDVVISNLADTSSEVNAYVFAENITIDRQSVGLFVTLEGAGVAINDTTISISYRIRENRNGIEVIHDCFETCSKL